METRANYVLIGAFTLAVIAAAFGFVLWFQSLHTTKQRSPIRIVFEGPASGLRNGGSVNFNGIRIGEVVSVKLDNPRRVVALAMVENNAPIRKDTLVGLEFQGLTGVAAISLKGGEENAAAVPLDEDGVPMLTADPSALQDVTESIRATLQNVNRIVADNQESVKNSLRNLETFTAALARNSEKIDNVMLRVDGVMGKADSLMLGLNTIAGGAAGGELNLMVKSIRELAEDFDKRSGALMADGRRTLSDISRAVNNFDRNPTRVIFGGGNNASRRQQAAAARPAPPQRLPEGAERAEAAVGRPRAPNVVALTLGSKRIDDFIRRSPFIVSHDHATVASAVAATIMSSALRGRPLAVPSPSAAPRSGRFLVEGSTRPANRACGPSGPANQASSTARFFRQASAAARAEFPQRSVRDEQISVSLFRHPCQQRRGGIGFVTLLMILVSRR